MGVADAMIRAVGGGDEALARRAATSGHVRDLWCHPQGHLLHALDRGAR